MHTAGSTDEGGIAQELRERYFLGRLSEELSELIAEQSAVAFDAAGIVIPVKSCSLMVAIERLQPAAARDLADALDRSHQLVSQKLPKLLQLGLVECDGDPDDLRRKLYRLTHKGVEQMALLRELDPRIDAAYADLCADVGDLPQILRDALSGLRDRPIIDRIGTLPSSAV